MHCEKSPFIDIGTEVTPLTQIGWVNHPNGHIDIRYSEGEEFLWDAFTNSLNLGRILTDNYSGSPDAISDDGSEYGSTLFDLHAHPIENDALDFDQMAIYMSYFDGTNNFSTEDILDRSAIRAGHNYNWIKYEERNNVGDQIGQNDNGHLSSSVHVDQRDFQRDDDYHIIYFKWYLNQTNLNLITDDINIEIFLWDWDGNPVYLNTIGHVTCIGCNPPTGTPDPPTLVSVAYSHLNSNIRLEWDEAEGSAEAKFFRIYRCLAEEEMTDRDKIGISSAWDNGHFFYEDNDPNLIPGANYKYAVAGVNYLGEGFNSNELSSLFGEMLASNIRSNTTLSGVYTIVSKNAVLTINPGAKITFRNGASLIVNGRLKAGRTD
jgi:hypothetical protein